tara:strand:- start:492 stop:695 length:204 start_codon:yes stop_codon:yes gene_type:complete
MSNHDYMFDKDFKDKVESPCLSICTYNNEDYCIGCKRHMNEIFDWYDYSDSMRSAIIQDLKKRRIDV